MQNNSENEPLISVCLPTYNRVEKLKRAIKKLQEQTYKNLEIIISDNYSTDNSENICIELGKKDKRIKYFRHTINHGPTANFEFAKKQVTGKYFLWHGDDDYLDNDYIKICVTELEMDSAYILVSGLAAYKKDGYGKITHYGNIIQANSNISVLRVIKYLCNVQDNSIFCGIYKTSILKKSYMPNVLAGDWIWIVEVLLKGKAKVIDTTYVNRSYGNSTSSSYENIINIINAPKWHAKYPLTAISKNFLLFYLKNENILIGVISSIIILLRGIWNQFKIYFKLGIIQKYIIKVFS